MAILCCHLAATFQLNLVNTLQHLRRYKLLYVSAGFAFQINMATAQVESDGAAVGNKQHDDRGDETPQTSSGNPLENNAEQKPVCLIVLGMAGSGKTTFVQVNTLMFYLHLYSYSFLLICSDWQVVHNRARAVYRRRCGLPRNAACEAEPVRLARCS